MKSRAVVFTINNPGAQEMAPLLALKSVRYCVYQIEQGDQGTKHVQGMAQFTSTTKLSTLKKAMPRAHIEPMRGTPTQARNYCMKEDTRLEGPYEFGVFTDRHQGKRNDLLGIKRRIDSGEDCGTIMEDEDCFQHFVKNESFFQRYQAYKRRRIGYHKPNVYVFYGDTGTNKTRTAFDIFQQDYWVWGPENVTSARWFDGYAGQENVIFDEFRGQIPYGEMLRLTDGYPSHKVKVSGGFTYWSPKNIIITSPIPPEQWYPRQNEKDSINQLLRRLRRQVNMDIEDTDDVKFSIRLDIGHVDYDTIRIGCKNSTSIEDID